MDSIRRFEPLFGDWYVESLIGTGSFGRVYRICRDELGSRFYSAMKYISIPSDAAEIRQLRLDGMDAESISTYYTELTKNITEETKLMSRLRGNTNIVSFEDSKVIPKPGGIGYDIFIKMELLTSLSSRILSAPLTKAETVKLGTDICAALELLRKFGIIHRDIKPDNIFVSDAGAFKLGDFGVARQLEKTAGFMSKKGTYNYMAPEVYRGESYGAGCDIYSLGLVMYRLLNNGRLPFLPPAPQKISPADREEALVRRMGGEPIPAPCGADPALSTIVLRACAPQPALRYAAAKEMRADLVRYALGISAAKNASAAQNPPPLPNAVRPVPVPAAPPECMAPPPPQPVFGGQRASLPQKGAAPEVAGKAKKRGKGRVLGLIVIIALAAILILAAAGVFLSRSGGKPRPGTDAESYTLTRTQAEPG